MKHDDLNVMRRRMIRGITMVICIMLTVALMLLINDLNNDPDWKWFHYNVNIIND